MTYIDYGTPIQLQDTYSSTQGTLTKSDINKIAPYFWSQSTSQQRKIKTNQKTEIQNKFSDLGISVKNKKITRKTPMFGN